MRRNLLYCACFVLSISGLAACKGSRKAADNNTWLNVGNTSGWYSRSNLLDAGKRAVSLYSSADYFKSSNPGADQAYRFRFNEGLLTDVVQQNLSGTPPTLADTPMQVRAPYYFVTVDKNNILGIQGADKFRIYLVESFAAGKGAGNYQMNLKQLQ